jgi:glycerol-3-phosphate dehydrogenase
MSFVSATLSPAARQQAIQDMAATPLDVLVIGAGVVGSGAALDAASRGLRVGLLEARDFAAGTSSRSSKLIHGGLRYLKQLNFSLVFEALRERSLMLDTLCPHLATPVPFLYPFERRFLDRAYVGLGVGVYDLLGAGRGVPSHHRHLSKKSAKRFFPGAKRGRLHGGVLFYEGQIDDARHTLMLARTAVSYGALAANSARVVGFLRERDRVVGARVLDLETGREQDVHARCVVNAAGVWTDEIQLLAGGRGRFRVQASKGVHVLVPRSRIRSQYGLITETARSLLFIIPCPWDSELWILGTTDTPWDLDLAHPAASESDIHYILGEANRLLEEPLTRADIVGVYAGLRPLLAGESDDTSKLSREHAVVSPVPGLVLVAGGKYTTYRVMAKDAVDAAVATLGRAVPHSVTDRTPLFGADGFHALRNNREKLAVQANLPVRIIDHLLGRYGSAITEVLALLQQRPDLSEPLPSAPHYLKVEVHYAVSHEGALHLDDILARRTRISIDTWHRGTDSAEEVAEIVAPQLRWDTAAIVDEVRHYRARVLAERDSQRQPDDQTADAARLGAPDVRVTEARPGSAADARPLAGS